MKHRKLWLGIILFLMFPLGMLSVVSLAMIGGGRPVPACVDSPGVDLNGNLQLVGDNIQVIHETVKTVTTKTTDSKGKTRTQTRAQTVTYSTPWDSSQLQVDVSNDAPPGNKGSADIYGDTIAVNGEIITSTSQVQIDVAMDDVSNSTDNADCGPPQTYCPSVVPSVSIKGKQILVGGIPLTPEQRDNAARIIALGDSILRPEDRQEGEKIALMVAYQESRLNNLPPGKGDKDSIGLFQQRPSQGWGSATQLQDVDYQIRKFYEALQKVPNWQNTPIIEVALAVQKPLEAAYLSPDNYFPGWEPLAEQLLNGSSVSGSSLANSGGPEAAIRFARSVLGTPYVWGGEERGGFDCSGLVWWAFAQAGYAFTRTDAAHEYNWGPHVLPSQLQRGDLVFWAYDVNNPSTIHHVAIYLGNNQIIYAPSTGDVVKIGPLYNTAQIIGGVRLGDYYIPQCVQSNASGSLGASSSNGLDQSAGVPPAEYAAFIAQYAPGLSEPGFQVPSGATPNDGTHQYYAQMANDGHPAYLDSPNASNVGGWAVVWHGPGNYIAVKYRNPPEGGNTIWIPIF